MSKDFWKNEEEAWEGMRKALEIPEEPIYDDLSYEESNLAKAVAEADEADRQDAIEEEAYKKAMAAKDDAKAMDDSSEEYDNSAETPKREETDEPTN